MIGLRSVLLLLALVARARAAGFPFGTANAVLDSVDTATEQDTFSFDSGPDQDMIEVRMTTLSGNLQPSYNLASTGHGGGCLSQSIGPVAESETCIIVAGVTYNLTVGTAIGPYGSGSYRVYFQSFRNPQGAMPIAYGQTLPGELTDAGEIDTWTFQGQMGDHFTVQTTRTSGQVDPIPHMYYGSPNTGVLGHSLTTCSGTFGSDDVPQVTLNCTLDQTGVYVLQLRDQNDGATPAIDPTETGGYTLALTCLDGPCTTATTTSTTTLPGGATTTSTTLPVTTEELVDGAHLVLKANGSKPQKAKLTVVLRDPDITVAATNGSADDPRTAGATLRVVAGGGDGFDDTYDIAAAHWTLVGPSGRNKGYRYVAKSGAPVRLALVKPKLVRINASGAGLMDTLATNPNPVHVVLTMGGVRYCASFGGSVTFKAGRSYDAKSAPAPGTCP